MDTRKMVHASIVVRRYLSPDIEVAAAVKRREITSYIDGRARTPLESLTVDALRAEERPR